MSHETGAAGKRFLGLVSSAGPARAHRQAGTAVDKVIRGKSLGLSGQREDLILGEIGVLQRLLGAEKLSILDICKKWGRSRCQRAEPEILIAQARYPIRAMMRGEGWRRFLRCQSGRDFLPSRFLRWSSKRKIETERMRERLRAAMV